MSILIRSMDIPTSCGKCRFCVNGFTDAAPMYECAVQSYDNVSVTVDYSGKPFNFRPDWCPLVGLPEKHGDLVDRDALMSEVMDSDLDHFQRDDWKEVIQIVQDAQTVQPEQCEDAVSRKTILKFLDSWMSALEDNVHNQSVSDLKIIKKDFENLPSAQPEIVRCKDCDWWTKQEDSPQGRCELLQMYPTGGWFCGNARRREVTK